MKIFALNLSIEFLNPESQRNYNFELISLEDLMGILFKGTEFNDQKLYVKGEYSEEFIQHVFEIQKNKVWRDMELNISFVFKSKEQQESFWEDFKELFKSVDAAGGLVQNERDEYLMIYNRKKWTLPKGHVEWQEPIEAAAEREVLEETGLKEVELREQMPETFHTFKKKKRWIMKTTFWYKMYASSDQKLTPETEEDIEDVKWMSKEEWMKVAADSYPLTRDLFVREFTKSLI
ncbi:MAG: NUDIX domain-containing protein [Bacteroidota bacterium]